jgi:hypothetical protein
VIRQLDEVIESLLIQKAPVGSKLKEATINFDLPDANWRMGLPVGKITVNCYLYDVKENRELRRPESSGKLVDKKWVRQSPPARIDCSYCITVWSPIENSGTTGISSISQEHEVFSSVLNVLLANNDFSNDIADILENKWGFPEPPRPIKVASQDGIKNQPEFWGALNQQLKPSINYVVNIAMEVGESLVPEPLVERVETTADNKKIWDEQH